MNLLLVEDDRRVSDFLVRGLRAEGYGVTLAVSGSEGLNFGLTGEFDLILLDLVLPGAGPGGLSGIARAPHVDAHPHADRPGHG
jgi:DNA-binding response OmpR family regulator